jgi:archaeosine synthase beta-subunit
MKAVAPPTPPRPLQGASRGALQTSASVERARQLQNAGFIACWHLNRYSRPDPFMHRRPSEPSLEYPAQPAARDAWILSLRPSRQAVDPQRPHGYLLEPERDERGEVVQVATLFLTNRECPWRCLMCDLWKATLLQTVPPGAISAQIDFAFAQLGLHLGWSSAQQVKLYNAGSFFDPSAIPPAEYAPIAERLARFQRVIVESHPSLVGNRCLAFRDLVRKSMKADPRRNADAPLEVAMGLETVQTEVLERLNKRMTLDQFTRAAEFLQRHGVPLRVFVLLKPPFMDEAEGIYWAGRSVEFAFDLGATAVSVIPTRPGNGALQALQAHGHFASPTLTSLEAALAHGISLQRGRVFADLWDLEQFSKCKLCFSERRERLRQMNLQQHVPPPVRCGACE